MWLQTLVVFDSESCHKSFPSFCAPPSEVAVMFDWYLSRRSFIGQVVNLDQLVCTGLDSVYVDLILFPIFTQRPMNDQRRLRSDERCFDWKQLLPSSYELQSKISFHMKTISVVSALSVPEIYKPLKTVMTFELSQYLKGFFLKRDGRCQHRLPPTWKLLVFVLARQTRPSCAWLSERCQKSLAKDFAVKPSIIFWNSLQ